MSVRIKICGITRREDALAALEYGVDALGFNFYSRSPRYIDLQTARDLVYQLPPFGLRVGIFVEPTFETVMETARAVRLDTIQLHGNEAPEIAEDIRNEGFRVWKAVHVSGLKALHRFDDYPCDALVLDAFDPKTPGGTGKAFDWSVLSKWQSPVPWILSGGLTPETVGEAVKRLNPSGVDVASGVESSPGIKDHPRMQEFIRNARLALTQD
jgi:phosphoribosylanthranilate isomerase